jgi:hypothetical protein
MGIAVLLLWVLTAGAGIRLLVTSGLASRREAGQQAQTARSPQGMGTAQAAPAFAEQGASTSSSAAASSPASATSPTPATMSKREAKRLARERYDPPTLVRARNEPLPGLRDLVEFAHPACGIIGLAFWLGYALVHNRTLAWIAFGLAAVTACAGLAWFTANLRAARRAGADGTAPFSARLIAIHGGALTFSLAALTALTARG